MPEPVAINLKGSSAQVQRFLQTVGNALAGLPLATSDYLALRDAVSSPRHVGSEGAILVVEGRNASALAERLMMIAKKQHSLDAKLEDVKVALNVATPASPNKLWLAIVAHEDVRLPPEWFWQANKPTDVEIAARYGVPPQLKVEALLDMTESAQSNPLVAAALADLANKKAAPTPPSFSRGAPTPAAAP